MNCNFHAKSIASNKYVIFHVERSWGIFRFWHKPLLIIGIAL